MSSFDPIHYINTEDDIAMKTFNMPYHAAKMGSFEVEGSSALVLFNRFAFTSLRLIRTMKSYG